MWVNKVCLYYSCDFDRSRQMYLNQFQINYYATWMGVLTSLRITDELLQLKCPCLDEQCPNTVGSVMNLNKVDTK